MSLPQVPACLRPVLAPHLRAGVNAKVALAEALASLNEANGRILCGAKLWDQMRAEYAKK